MHSVDKQNAQPLSCSNQTCNMVCFTAFQMVYNQPYSVDWLHNTFLLAIMLLLHESLLLLLVKLLATYATVQGCATVVSAANTFFALK